MTFEHRDSDGNPTLPKHLIEPTYSRRYEEVPADTEIKALVLKDYKPKFLLVERKIYTIHDLYVHGWRRRGRVIIEMARWRQHEAAWFDAMRGARLTISEHARNEKSDYTVFASSFDEKIVTSVNEQRGNSTKVELYEGVLDIAETWRSAWRRQNAEVLSMGFKLFLVPLVVAVASSGLTMLWLNRSQPGGDSSSSSGISEQRMDQPLDSGQLVAHPEQEDENRDSPDTPTQVDDAEEPADHADPPRLEDDEVP